MVQPMAEQTQGFAQLKAGGFGSEGHWAVTAAVALLLLLLHQL